MLKKFLSMILSLSLILSMFNFSAYALGTEEVNVDDNIIEQKTNMTLKLGEFDGKPYTFKTELDENNSIVATEIRVKGELVPVRVEFDSNTGIITSNGKVVGEFSTSFDPNEEMVSPNEEMISPYDTGSASGGGGQKVFVRQSSVRIDSKDWEVLVSIAEFISGEGAKAAAALLGITGLPVKYISLATSSFVKYVMNSAERYVTTYHKTFYTGQVMKQDRFYYHRYLTEFYKNSNYTGYLGCEWGDSMIRR